MGEIVRLEGTLIRVAGNGQEVRLHHYGEHIAVVYWVAESMVDAKILTVDEGLSIGLFAKQVAAKGKAA